jgi:hypothetical protein
MHTRWKNMCIHCYTCMNTISSIKITILNCLCAKFPQSISDKGLSQRQNLVDCHTYKWKPKDEGDM